MERIPLPPVYRHSGEGISLRHWLLPHLSRESHSLLCILTGWREYHSDTGCCLTSGENTTPSCISSLMAGNITQTLAAVSPQETIPLPPAYPHWRREYHSDTGCCLISGEYTTPSCLSSLGEGISLRHWLLPHLRREYHSLLSILTHGREYHSDTGCCLTSGDNTTPSCLSSLRGGSITQTLAAASPQETIPLPPVYRHLGEGISLRHWLLPHLRRQYHSLLPILTQGREYHSDTGCCLTSREKPLPPVYPHCGREYHSDTGCCLTSGENTTPPCLSSLEGGNITQTLAAASPQGKIPLAPVYPHCGREYHTDTGCCLSSGENTTPSCLSSLGGLYITQTLAAASPQETMPLPPVYRHLGEGLSLRHWLLPQFRRQYHSLVPILTAGREYHSDTGCCLTSGENTTPSCLSSLGGGNITQTLAAASPQETMPLPPGYRHLGEGISLRHWLLPHLRRQCHSLLSIVTWGKEYHSDTGCCLTSGDNTTPSCLSSLRGGNITQTLAADSPQDRIPLPPAYPHLGEGISLRHWLLPHLRRQYHSLLSILTRGGNITQTLAAASPQD